MRDPQSHSSPGFGTFQGIFVPNVTMMFGVIIFLRLGLVVGNLGLFPFIVILVLSLGIMLLTSLSIATVVTNMNVGGGGVYYLISRSLGIEVGGAIGIALVLAQLASIVLCISGFAYSFLSIFPNLDLRLVELISIFLLASLSFVSANFALKTQLLIFVILLISIGSIFIGHHPPTEATLKPFFQPPLTFWKGFALFYPALTGIEAGMALSGTLKNPSRSLSIGNMISLIFVALSYLSIAIFLSLHFDRKILSADPSILLATSKFPWLIYIGIWSATLSSALGALIGAPRILHMIAEDNIAPEFLSRTYGKYQEPRYALGVIFLISALLLMTTTIDQILPILSMICLLTYGTINLVAGLSTLVESPSWRPTFRVRWQYPIFGALGCLYLMLMIDPTWTFASIFLLLGLYFFLRSRSLDVSFEDIRESILLFFSRLTLYRLLDKSEGAKNWLPQILVATRSSVYHERLIRIAYEMTGRSGILTVATLLPQEWETPDQLEKTRQLVSEWLKEKSIRGFCEVQAHGDFFEGILSLIKTYGMGPLQPNTILFPVTKEEKKEDLLKILETATTYQKNVLLFFDDPEKDLSSFSTPSKKRKQIDLWWDPSHRAGFELMLSLILILRSSPIWNYRQLTIHTIAHDARAKESLKTYFSSFLKKIRLRCKVQISIADGFLYDHVARESKEADLILYPLRFEDEFESKDQYASYLEEIKSTLLQSTAPTFALHASDRLDHREVYLPETSQSTI